MTTYKNRFKEAYNRTQNFNLNPPEITYSNDIFLTKDFVDKVPSLLFNEFGSINPNEMYANCMGFHYKLKPFFEEHLSSEVYFTLGYVTMHGEKLFYLDDLLIESLLKSGLQSPPSIHAWLTLPSMEILDFTLCSTYSMLKNIKDGIGRVTMNHADNLKDEMIYHPILIGDVFLRKIGGLIEL